MKRIAVLFSFLFTVQLSLMGATPYNLEGLYALNILVLDENDILTPAQEKRLKTALKTRLEENGIAGNKDGVGAVFLKLTALKMPKSSVVHLTLGVGEEAIVKRKSAVETYVLAYSLDDMIETQNIEADVYESAINYLLDEFLEQFHEDNEE